MMAVKIKFNKKRSTKSKKVNVCIKVSKISIVSFES